MILTISERFALSSVLPPHGNILTLKDIRQLREELAMSDGDRKAGVQFYNELKCPKCGVVDIFPTSVKCGECDVWMRPTGKMGCSNWEFEKEIPIPEYLIEMITATLKSMNDDTPPTLEERHISIYDKFVGAKEKEDKK